MNVLSAIDSRVSAVRFGEPGPSKEHIKRILQAGVRGPDHGRLAPWRFIVLEGEARNKLGEAMARTLAASSAGVGEENISRERQKPLRAPTVIVAAARTVWHDKVPEIEQVIAVGAAVQNMLLAVHELGYGAAWKTGAAAYASIVKTALGLDEGDHIVGFIYLGSVGRLPEVREADISGVVQWL